MEEQLTPMMQKYLETKNEYKDCILFYRLGDFYEMFFEDAKCASKELELTLTGKSCGLKERAPMCGVPFHSAEGYITRLVSKGYKVAICEQVEDPKLAKGLVKREVVRIVTPGIPDKKLIYKVTRSYYAGLVRQGVRIYEYTPGFIHSKSFVCDDEIATVGTINMDYRSFFSGNVILTRSGST